MNPQHGPMTICENSMTRTPASGKGCAVGFATRLFMSRSSLGMDEGFRQSRASELSIKRLSRQPLREPTLRLQETGKIDAGIEPHRLEHKDEIFGGDVAARSRRMRTSAEPSKRCIERADTLI